MKKKCALVFGIIFTVSFSFQALADESTGFGGNNNSSLTSTVNDTEPTTEEMLCTWFGLFCPEETDSEE